jgi:uncharacterized membrane protein YdbT with pleckstrin-like domain
MGFYIVGLIVAVVAGAIAKVADKTSTGVLAFAVVFVLVLLVGLFKRMSTSYTITSERLHIRRGLLSRREQQTKLERVQNVNTAQSFLERLLQVGSVDFDTAGTDDSDFIFAGVANPEEIVSAVDHAQRAAAGAAGAAAPQI